MSVDGSEKVKRRLSKRGPSPFHFQTKPTIQPIGFPTGCVMMTRAQILENSHSTGQLNIVGVAIRFHLMGQSGCVLVVVFRQDFDGLRRLLLLLGSIRPLA